MGFTLIAQYCVVQETYSIERKKYMYRGFIVDLDLSQISSLVKTVINHTIPV